MQANLRLVGPDDAASSPPPEPDAAPVTGPSEGQLNLRLLQPLARYLLEEKGHDVLTEVAASIGLSPADFDRGSVWVSAAEFDLLLREAREHLADDDELRDACAFRMAEEYGPLRFVVRATTPYLLFRQAARHFEVISRVSRLDVGKTQDDRVRITYRTDVEEGRLSCLSRQAQMAAAPTLWGLPKAELTERGCVAQGDEACVYDMRIYRHRRFWPVLLGMLLGGGLGALLFGLHALWGLPILTVLCGGLLGYALEMHRTHRANLSIGEEANEALRRLAKDEAAARLEIVDLHQRQRRWTQMLEEQLTERSQAVQRMTERLERVGEDRVETLRGVSHDLNNPLLVLSSHVALLETTDVDPRVVRDMESAVDRMRTLLRELMQQLTGDVAVRWRHEELDVGRLTEQLRRRMKALVFGREIRVSVFRAREAPAAIRCDPVLFDRVMDNLLTNAAKYTDLGSIVVEVGGTPGYLTLKVSDTGRGIPAERLERIFEAGATDESERAAGSFGVGLSVVVHLLGRIGGRLEVMSRPDVGTTFWAHFPTEPSAPGDGAEDEAAVRRVLTIRETHD